MILPVNYNETPFPERRLVREEYVKRQKGLCSHCDNPLTGPASDLVELVSIDESLFPENFFKWPIHLHHCHKTGLTIGAVHARCNAYLWQYKGEQTNFNMINPINFPDWQFEFPPCYQSKTRSMFKFKSPRLNNWRDYNSVLNPDTDEALREYEKECYLNQVMFGVSVQLQHLQDDIRRQLQLHINRGLPLPSELKACVDLKIV